MEQNIMQTRISELSALGEMTPSEYVARLYAHTDENRRLIVPAWNDDGSVHCCHCCEVVWTEADRDRTMEEADMLVHALREIAVQNPALSDSEEERLMERMKQILPYGNVAFVTSDAPNSDAARYARDWFLNYFGKVSGTVLLIDMYNRRIEIFSGEAVYRQINTTRANEITDNSYEYASRGDYFGCADKTFEQMVTVLEGGSIVTPIRFATNAAFAIGIVFLVNFVIVYMQRRKARDVMALRTANDRKGADNLGAVKSVRKVMTSQTKRKHVEASSGGGGGFSGGGGGGFSGGGGGGGFSGGGGGHSF